MHLWFSCSLEESETGFLKDFKWFSKWGTVYFQPHEQRRLFGPHWRASGDRTDIFISSQECKLFTEKDGLGQSLSAFIVPSVFPSSPTCLHPETPPFTFKDPLLISLGGEKPNSLTNWISIFCSCWITARLFFSLLDLRVFRLSELRSAKIHQDEIKLLCKEENENVNVSVVGRKTNDLLIFTNPVR